MSLPRSMVDEDAVWLVPSHQAHALRAKGGYRAVESRYVTRLLESLDRRRQTELRSFLARAGLAGSAIDRLDDQRLLALVRESLRDGRLIVVEKGPAGPEQAGVTVQLRRLVRDVDKATRGRLSHRGRQYKLVADVDLASVPGRDQYVVLSRAAAESTLTEISLGPDAPSELRTLLGQVRDRLTRDWRPPLSPDGLVMLRREVQVAARRVDEPAITPSQLKRRMNWLELRVVWEDTGEPVSGVPLVVEHAGDRESRKTDADGRIRLEGVEDACEVTSPRGDAGIERCLAFVGLASGSPVLVSRRARPGGEPPLAIVAIDEHRGRSGETLASIAAQADLDWQTLAKFNWGTDVPAEIDARLRDEVGCTKRTLDGRNHLLDDTDNPGILYVPRPWTWRCQPRQSYCFRVRRPKGVLLVLENEEGLRLPEVAYQVTFDDGSRREGRLGRSGLARVPAPSSGGFAVTYPDEVDMLAKSLAASVRRGLCERKLEQIFRLFAHDRPVVAQAVAAYDRYWNDYGGQGLVEDLYQELIEPEALAMCEALMAMHGLPTRSTVAVADPAEEA